MKLPGFIVIGVITGAITLLFAFTPVQEKQKVKWTAPETADKKTNPVASNEENLAIGKGIFIKTCAVCHGKKGIGDGPKSAELEIPVGNLTKADAALQSDGALFWKITEGRKPMPSFKKELTDEQRWMVVNYVREFGPKKLVGSPK